MYNEQDTTNGASSAETTVGAAYAAAAAQETSSDVMPEDELLADNSEYLADLEYARDALAYVVANLNGQPINVFLASALGTGIPIGFLADAIREQGTLSVADASLLETLEITLSGLELSPEDAKRASDASKAATKAIGLDGELADNAETRQAMKGMVGVGGELHEWNKRFREELGIPDNQDLVFPGTRTSNGVILDYIPFWEEHKPETGKFGGLAADTCFFFDKDALERYHWSAKDDNRSKILTHLGVVPDANKRENLAQLVRMAIANALRRVGADDANKMGNGQPVDGMNSMDARLLNFQFKEPNGRREFLWKWFVTGLTDTSNIDKRYRIPNPYSEVGTTGNGN
jgi:hypothetical protein